MPIYRFIGTWSPSSEEQTSDVEIKTAAECFHSDVNDLRVLIWREAGSLDWRTSFVFRNHPYRFDGPTHPEYPKAKGYMERMMIVAEIIGLCDTSRIHTMTEFLSTWEFHLSTLTKRA